MKSIKYSSGFKMIISALLMLCFSFAHSQTQPVNQTDANGKKQGLWKKYDGTLLISKGTYKDGFPEGEFTYYYDNGSKKGVSVFSEKAQKVSAIAFYRSGAKMSEGNYINKQKDGVWKYYTETNVLLALENYIKGSREGDWNSYYLTGIINLEAHYLNNNKSGIWKSYFPDGKLKSMITYQNDQTDGKIEYYFPSQKIMISGSFNKGLQDGKWLYYDTTGKNIRTEVYNKGVMTSRNGTIPEVNDTIKLPEPPKL